MSVLILIAEDSYLTAAEMERILLDDGFRVRLAPDPEKALKAADAERPALAVIDLNLRDGMDGTDLARILAGRGIPVVVCTRYRPEAVENFAGEIGAVAFLQKPVLRGEFLCIVRMHSGSAPGAVSPSARADPHLADET